MLKQSKENELELKYPKLSNFLLLYNFRDSYSGENGVLYDTTKIIRIYFDEENVKDGWFEFGMYDFGSNYMKREDLNKILSKKLLDMYVYSIRVDEDTNNLAIYVASKEYVENI